MINRLFTTLLSQAAGFLGGVLVGFFLEAQSFFPIIVLVLHTVIATLVAYFLKCTRPWVILNALIPIGMFVSTYLPLSYSALIILTLFVVLLFLPTFFSGVPFYPTSKEAYDQILKLIPESKITDQKLVFLDLGSGFGALLSYLSTHRPDITFIGVEISPLAWLTSKVWLWQRKNIKITFKDMWDLNLSDYDFVYAFLAPGPMPRLWQKVREEMRQGCTFITNTFDVNATPSEKIKLKDNQQSELLVFKL